MTEPRDEGWFPRTVDFSPGMVDLGDVLRRVHEHQGDREAIVSEIRAEYFSDAAEAREDSDERLEQQRQRANNVLWGMGPNGLGLFSLEDATLTEAGRRILELQDENRQKEELARHILKNCRGMVLLQAIRDLQARGEQVKKSTLQQELERHGIDLPRATTYHLRVVAWLREGGVIEPSPSYEINEEVVERLTGMSVADVEGWGSLTQAQAAFLRTLRRMAEIHGKSELLTKDVLEQAVLEHGRIFRADQIASTVTQPLADKGWIELERTSSGRGGKSGVIRATERLLSVDLDLVTDFSGVGIPSDLRPRLNTPLEQIQEELDSEDTHLAGIALELLALRIAIDLGLMPLRFRERSSKTGGAEVDLLADGVHLHYSRWSFQCKNTQTVTLSDLAKEIGLATMFRGHVVVMVTTGRFAASVRTHAHEVMRTTALQVVLVSGETVRRYLRTGPSPLRQHFHETAGDSMRLKRGQVLEE